MDWDIFLNVGCGRLTFLRDKLREMVENQVSPDAALYMIEKEMMARMNPKEDNGNEEA